MKLENIFSLNNIKLGFVVLLFLYVMYRFYRLYKHREPFLGQQIKTGREMDYDLSSEITKLHKLQEDNLQKLV